MLKSRLGNHQFVRDGQVMNETLFADQVVRFLYSTTRERAPFLFRMVTGKRFSSWLGYWNFDMRLGTKLLGNRDFLKQCGVDLSECVEEASYFDTARKIFERQIRYWECRPEPKDPGCVVSPADSRMLVGNLDLTSVFHVKNKFFELPELLAKEAWVRSFDGGSFAAFRLTPELYHYNHTPVAGRVLDVYQVMGDYHACNPAAVIEMVTPYSKNRRWVTVIDTDVPGGTGVGLVAMVEVVALMIGDLKSAYSEKGYEDPRALQPGMMMQRGVPKSLFRPGSSTDILLFEPGRIQFEPTFLENQRRAGVESRFNSAFQAPLVETEVRVRQAVAYPKAATQCGDLR